MSWLFFVFVVCAIAAIPAHFASVEHAKLARKYGEDTGIKIGEVYGRISAYLLFVSLIGLWFSPQPRFTVPVLQHAAIRLRGVEIPVVHFVVFLPFAVFGALLLVRSVSGITRRVSEAHHPEKIVTDGIYSSVRHPQYLGFLLMHIGFSFLMSALYALIATPLILLLLYSFARKEEVELAREFGTDEYDAYRRSVPILIPRVRARKGRRSTNR